MRPLLGTWPATQACALTGNQTGDPLVCRPALQPLSYTSQGLSLYFLMTACKFFNLFFSRNFGNWPNKWVNSWRGNKWNVRLRGTGRSCSTCSQCQSSVKIVSRPSRRRCHWHPQTLLLGNECVHARCLVLHAAGGLAADLFHLKNFLLHRKLYDLSLIEFPHTHLIFPH